MAKHDRRSLEDATRELLAESLQPSSEASEHPDLEDLAAYHEGRLDDAGSEALRRHLLFCDDCAAVVLDLAQLEVRREPKSQADTTDLDLDRSWQRQKALLGIEDSPEPRTPDPSPPTEAIPTETMLPPPPSLPPWARAVAAMLVTAVLGLGSWVVTLQQSLEDLRRLQTNPPLVNLEPLGSSRRSADAPPALVLPEESTRGWLILNVSGPLEGTTFRALLLDSTGQELLTLAPLERSEAGNFRLEISRRHLPAGDLRILLLDAVDDDETLAEYQFRLSTF